MEPRKDDGKARPEHREGIYKGDHLQKLYKARCRQTQRKTPVSQIPKGSSNIPNELSRTVGGFLVVREKAAPLRAL